jgi:penicillin-binding protein 2
VTTHLLLHAEGDSGSKDNWRASNLPIGMDHVRRIRDGMWQSVNNFGTGHNAAIPGLDICGKTGTVQVIGNEKRQQLGEEIEDHSWFVGFANRDNPEIAVVVFIEHGGKGGVAAAPIARQILKAYFDKKSSKTTPGTPAPANEKRSDGSQITNLR